MSNTQTADQILDKVFLEVRAKLLEVGAALDRLDRAGDGLDSVKNDPRYGRIMNTLELLRDCPGDRAEQIQLLFSIPFEKDWRTTLQVDAGR